MRRKYMWEFSAYIALFFILFIFYLHISYHTGYNSDSASILLEAKEMADGNWLLKNWTLSTVTFYFTDALLYALIIKIFGYSHDYIYIVPSLGYALASLFLIVFSNKYTKSRSAVFIASLFFVIPAKFVGDTVTLPVFHGMTILYFIIAILVFFKATQDSLKWFILYIPLVSILTFSDDIVKYWLLLPSLISALYIYKKNKTSKNKKIIFYTFLPIVGYIFLKLIARTLGFAHLPGMKNSFVEFSLLKDNIYWFFENLFNLFNSNFFGKQISIKEAAKPLLNTAAFLAMCYSFYKIIKAKKISHTTLLFVSSIVIICISFILSDVYKSEGSTRYLLSLSFLFPLIWAKNYSTTDSKKEKALYIIVAILACSSTLHSLKFKSSPLPLWHQSLSTHLEEKELFHGYSDFWDAANTTVNGKITLRQVYFQDGLIRAQHWLSNEDWYSQYANFIVCSKNLCGEDPEKKLTEQFGKIQEVIKTSDNTIYIWNHDISKQIVN